MGCSYCLKGERHPLWCYLATSGPYIERSSGSRVIPYIGVSSHPFRRLRSHNRLPGYPVGAKSLNSHAPHWQLQCIIGPFFQSGACTFKRQWRAKSRKTIPRLVCGIQMAMAYKNEKLHIFVENPAWVKRILLRT
jgi:hypothetical protein